MVMSNVALIQVSKVFARGVSALRDVNLRVEGGEILVLLGPNGSGKTTLLRLIAGLERPSSGEIRIDGQVADRLSPHERDVAMLFQSCVLYPHLTVERNIAFGLDGRFGGWLTHLWRGLADRMRLSAEDGAPSVPDRVRQTAKIVGVEHLLERYPRQLSGGERQRVALARVFVRQPAVFLLDEPWSNVDVRLRRVLRCELRALRQRTHAATILVTHDHSEALALGDRIAVLDQGRVHQVGTPAEILDDPQTRFVAEFAGKLANCVPGWLRTSESGWFLEASAWDMRSRVVPAAMPDSSRVDRPVWLAFEPLGLAPNSLRADSELSFSGRVVGQERVAEGWQILVKRDRDRTDNDDCVLIARVDQKPDVQDGQSIRLTIGFDRVRVFDRETENRIHLGLERAK